MQVLILPQLECCPPGVHSDTSISHSLSDVSRPGVNACLLKRRLPVPEAAARALLPAEAAPFRVREVYDCREGQGLLPVLRAQLPQCAAADVLLADVSAVALLFCSVLGLHRARLTLQGMTSAVCSRWHSDYVMVRGLVTYCGGGTQFLDDRDADRRQLQRLIGSDTGGFRVRRGGTVRQAATGDLLLLKGHSYAGNAGRGAVHRSPEASPSAPRLLLVVDDAMHFPAD